ncbi:hypothetical protein KSP39_PZI000416 [Platanthera zijinensis]|uniref:Secreted protein n=1 Tax=Platanthera zijinensis TaxID=2320716 RepID=A0AAP0C005_9ASPA
MQPRASVSVSLVLILSFSPYFFLPCETLDTSPCFRDESCRFWRRGCLSVFEEMRRYVRDSEGLRWCSGLDGFSIQRCGPDGKDMQECSGLDGVSLRWCGMVSMACVSAAGLDGASRVVVWLLSDDEGSRRTLCVRNASGLQSRLFFSPVDRASTAPPRYFL